MNKPIKSWFSGGGPRFAPLILLLVLAGGCGKDVSLAPESNAEAQKDLSLREQLEKIRGVTEAPEAPVLKLAPGPIAETLSITGELVPSDSVIVRPLMDGRLHFLRPIKVGDTVKAGETIAKIDDRDIEDQIERQRKQIEIGKEKLALGQADLDQRRKDLTFDEELMKKGYLNQNEFEKSAMALRQSEIGLRQSEIELEQENMQLSEQERKREKVPIVAPIAGMIVPASHLKSGQQGNPLLNEEIMSLEDTLVGSSSELFGIVSSEGYLAQCMVNGKDKARLQEGQAARLTVVSHRPIVVPGVMARLSLLQDPQTHAYKVWLKLGRRDPSFTSGLFVRADVELARHENALTIDKRFLKQRNNRNFVQIVEDDRVRDVWVETGLSNEERVELVSGVEAGQMLIASAETYSADQAVKPGVILQEEPASVKRYGPAAGALPLAFVNRQPGDLVSVIVPVDDDVTSDTRASVRLTLNDVDATSEVILFVNGKGPLSLPESMIGDNQTLSGSLDLPAGCVQSGDNDLKFVFGDNLQGRTNGFRIEGVELLLGR